MYWSSEQKQVLRQLYERSVLTYRQIAEEMSRVFGTVFTDEQVRAAVRRMKNADHYAGEKEQTIIKTANAAPQFSTKPEHITCDTVTVVADLHVPYHNRSLLSRMIRISKLFNSDTLVIAGDFFDFGSLSVYPPDYKITQLKEELSIAGDLLCELSTFFSHIIIHSGNHDERFCRRVNEWISLSDVVQLSLTNRTMSCMLTVSDFDFVHADVAGNPWTFGHLSSFSKRPGEKARQLAESQGRNIAVGHDHIQGYSSTMDGEFIGISIGSMVHMDEDGFSPFWYKERRLSTMSPVTNGFLVINNGQPWLFNAKGSSSLNGKMDWSFWDNQT